MGRRLLFLGCIATLLFIACQQAVRQCSPPPEQSISEERTGREFLYETRESEKSKALLEKEQETIGYLDNPAPRQEKRVRREESPETPENRTGPGPQVLEAPVQATQTPQRMVAYDASIETRSPRPDSVIGTAIGIALHEKGYVESRNNTSVVLRIPSSRFDTVFNALLKIGDIINYRKSAEDITDAFQDTDLRIALCNRTIERYVNLVNTVKDEEEKLKLLKEIEKLREELENLEAQKKYLSLQAGYARIDLTVQPVTPRARGPVAGEIGGFEWIQGLDPFSVTALGERLEYPVPDGMVRITGGSLWLVESAGGSKVWSSRLPNRPRGDARFWIAAIKDRISGQFATVDTTSLRGYEFIRLTPYPGSKYVYYIGITIYDGSIRILQAYFPDENQERRYRQSVMAILEKEGA